tara:strand:+ start:643 stop:1119 length:477 start_codon:yes stop_codon:yes gene_type:complete
MINYTKSIIFTLIILTFAACDNPVPLTNPPANPEPLIPVELIFVIPEKFTQYKKLIPSTQHAFCRNLHNGTNLKSFKFKDWIAEVDTVSRFGNNEYKVKLDTPCTSIETQDKWKVLPENPMYSQLAKVEKGQPVFISGSYTVKKNSSTVDLNYFSIVW